MANTKLDSYLSSYTDFNDWMIQRRYQSLKDYFQGEVCLDMGIAEGTGVEDLLDHFKKVVLVDGSETAIEHAKKRYPSPKLQAVHAYFEDMDFGGEKFDTIVMAHILEHVDDPQQTISQAKKFLKPGGVLIIDVPNGNSLHRQIGVKMGLLKKKTELNAADLSIGHQRVYTPETFRQEIEKAKLRIVKFGGMFIKVLSNAQMERVFDATQREALFTAGEDNPEIAAEMYIVATPNRAVS